METEFETLATVIYDHMPWEGESYQAVAENIALALIQSGWKAVR